MLDTAGRASRPGRPGGFPARVVAVYGVVGLAWIAGSGAVAGWIARVTGVPLDALELAKGFGFILATSVALFAILIVEQRRLHEAAVARERLEEELRQAQKLEAVGRLAGGIAHDFNNLLTAISGYAHLVRTDLDAGAVQAADVEEVIHAADRARDLVAQLLAFSRRQPSAPRPTALDEAVRALLPMLHRLVPAHVELVAESHAPDAAVLIDPIELDQIVLNLVVNAVDAMREGGRLEIATARSGDRVRLIVADTGDGMDAATRERVFEPFFTTKPPGRGTGLGLSTVYGIVQRAGGAIAIDSEPGRGTSLIIDLPISIPMVGEIVPQPVIPADVRGVRILVVEDDATVRGLARDVLTRAGCAVDTAERPSLALAALEAVPYDLVVTDIVMPEMSGHALAARVRERHQNTRVLFMSAYAERDEPDTPLLQPSDAFIQKPFDPDGLVSAVARTLGRR